MIFLLFGNQLNCLSTELDRQYVHCAEMEVRLLEQQQELKRCAEKINYTDTQLSAQSRLREEAENELQRWKKELNRQRDKVVELESRLTVDASNKASSDRARDEELENEIHRLRTELNDERLGKDELQTELSNCLRQVDESESRCAVLEVALSQSTVELKRLTTQNDETERQLSAVRLRAENERHLLTIECASKADFIKSLTSEIELLALNHTDELRKVMNDLTEFYV